MTAGVKGSPVATPGSVEEFPVPGDLLAQGKSLMKAGTPFVTAISVQKPRNLDVVVKNLMRECEYGGDSFYYSMAFGKQRIEGGSIGLALSIAREWTNSAVTMNVEETPESFIFTGRFIDLEKGFQIERAFRQRKAGQVYGNFDPERKLDIAFQIGQSKAIRNVVLSGVPRWLVEKCIDAAKATVAASITPEGLEKSKVSAIASFVRFKVTEAMLVAKVGKPVSEWVTRDIADLRGDFKALENGEMSVGELFPQPETQASVASPAPGPFGAEAFGGAKAPSEPPPGAPPAPGAPGSPQGSAPAAPSPAAHAPASLPQEPPKADAKGGKKGSGAKDGLFD